jgi:hypothetical protein
MYTPTALRPRVAGPVVIDAADLRGGNIGGMLMRDYNDGQTVSIANATAAAATSLARELGSPGTVQFSDGVRRAELVAFRKIDQGGRTIFSTSILPPTTHVSVAPADRKAGRQLNAQDVRTYLQGLFSATPAVPAQPEVSATPVDLLSVAAAAMTTNLYHDDSGAELQLTDTVYSVRSFTNSADYYYVLQELIAKAGTTPFAYVITYNTEYYPNGINAAPPPVLLQPSPQSNPPATTYSVGASLSIGGSFGINEAQGLNASINASVTISSSTSVTVPPIQIYNQVDPASGNTQWEYWFSNPPQQGEASTFYDSWIWQVPFSDYPHGTGAPPAELGMTSEAIYAPPSDIHDQKGLNWIVNAPAPFGQTFTLDSPRVLSVSDPTVKPGGIFTIEGSALYPSLVLGVLIGGQPLNAENFSKVNDHEIQVVAPDTPGKDLPVVVQTTQGYSKDVVTITITGSRRARQLADPGSPARRLLG